MKLYDCHMHTCFSSDSEADPLKMIASARARGLSGITITDHVDWDYKRTPELFQLDIDDYCLAIDRLKEEHSDKSFTLRKGIETGLQTHLAERQKELATRYNFDYIIGSIHQIDGEDPYYDDYWDNLTYRQAYARFFEVTLENIKAFHDFDALGHLDYISRYAKRIAKSRGDNENDASVSYSDHSEVIDEILKLLIRYDISLEINTAPFKYGYSVPNPSWDIIKRYRDYGGCCGRLYYSPREFIKLWF